MERRHPDIFTAAEAAAYLGLPSERSLEPLRERWGLRPLPIGKGLYHREDLDHIVEKARTGDQKPAKRPGRGSRLTIGG